MIPWQYRAAAEDDALILPDGCVDVIVSRPESGPPVLAATSLDAAPRRVRVARGVRMVGIRLQPGVRLDHRALADLWRQAPETGIDALARAAMIRDPEAETLIGLLAGGARLAEAARMAGASPRAVQRRFAAQRLPVPEFWRLLGRVRRAALALGGPEPLAEIACDHGFSDQAHMTRAFARWLGTTPARLRGDPELLGLVGQAGLGNWTGEQISTR